MRIPRLEPGNARLTRLRSESGLEVLAGYLRDPKSSRSLRRRAALTIASIAPGGGKASTLYGYTDPRVIPHLAPLLEGDPDPTVRRSAAYGLRRTNDEAAIPALLGALSDEDKATRTHAIIGLGDLKSREALGPLVELLGHRPYTRTAALALANIGDERALKALKDAALTDKSGRRRKQILSAARELEDRVGLDLA